MSNTPSRRKYRSGGVAGGFFIAIGLLAGVVIGTVNGQPTIGMLAGAGIGLALAILVSIVDWLLGLRR